MPRVRRGLFGQTSGLFPQRIFGHNPRGRVRDLEVQAQIQVDGQAFLLDRESLLRGRGTPVGDATVAVAPAPRSEPATEPAHRSLHKQVHDDAQRE